MLYSKDKKSKKKLIVGICILIFIVIVTLFVLEKTGVTNLYTKEKIEQPSATQYTPDTINYNPPTESETKSGDSIKQEIIESENKTQPDYASVVIVDAKQYEQEIEVRAFVSNVIQDGICTITFSKNSQTIEKTVKANADATTSPCTTLKVARSEFKETGVWNVEINYTSNTVIGSSKTNLEIK
jgi:hypothetical protein